MNITLRQLSYLVALAEERHFGRAAQRVHVTQPALSTQIRELEDRLGAQLIDRSDRAFRLTPAGQEVLTSATRIMGEVERMETTARWQEGLTGRLKLGIIPTVAPYLLPAALPKLRMRDVTLDLRLTEAKTERLIDALADGALDAAIMAIPSGVPGLVEEPLFRDHFVLAGSRDYIERTREVGAPGPETLNPNALLLLDEGHCLADQALEVCGTHRVETRVNLRASSLPTLCGMVAAGLGQTLLPEISLAKECAAAPDLDVMAFAEPQPFRTIGLVRRDIGGPDGWFAELAALIKEASTELLGHATIA